MKYIFKFLFLYLFIISCSKDKNTIGTIDGTVLTTDEILKFLPPEYEMQTDLLYKNSKNEIKLLKVKYLNGNEENTYNNSEKYTSKTFSVSLYDPNNLNFTIVLLGGANYTEPNRYISMALTSILMPFNPTGTTWFKIYFENGKPIISKYDNFQNSLVLYNKTFKDVLVTKSTKFLDSYSELYINSFEGVVAFRDDLNELWVFEKFVK